MYKVDVKNTGYNHVIFRAETVSDIYALLTMIFKHGENIEEITITDDSEEEE